MKMIPHRGEYVFHKGSFVLRSKWSKRFKIVMFLGIFLGGLMTAKASYHHYSKPQDGMFYAVEDAALVDYVSKYNKVDAIAIVKSTLRWAKEFNIDPKMILAIQQAESTFNKHAISTAGAFGLMQVLPKWHLDKIKEAKQVIGNPELFDINTNIYLGTWIFKDCLIKNKVEGQALKCYNGSIGMPTDYDAKVISAHRSIKNFVKGAA